MFNVIRKWRLAKATPVRVFTDEECPGESVGPSVFARGTGSVSAKSDAPRLEKEDLPEWMSSLDESIRPVQLAHHYPHVAVALMQHWSERRKLQACLRGLIFSDRGDQKGFPTFVLRELLRLQAFVADRPDHASPPPRSAHATFEKGDAFHRPLRDTYRSGE